MAAITYGVSTELDAVNAILMSVGESPVNTLTVQSPDVAIAQATLRQVCREIQTQGWVYNTENDYPIDLDANNHCVIPNNILQLDLNHFRHGNDFDVVRRSDNGIMKVYDKIGHSFEFKNVTGGKLYFDVIWMLDFEDLPQAFKDYITTRASRIASNRMVNNPQAAKLLESDEALARAAALEYDTSQADYNIFTDTKYQHNPNSTYRPSQVIRRM
mgnify:FL=1|tara:strand:- start:347 stop:991 length:645 start_codon:yes stop_codon:yes gene_type:complete